MSIQSAKPTLQQLRRSYNQGKEKPITSEQLARGAGVPLREEYLMELGRPVDALVANRIINTFNALTGKNYTFADIDMSLKNANASVGHSPLAVPFADRENVDAT